MFEIRSETRQAFHLLAGVGLTSLLGIAYGVYATRMLDVGAVGEFTHALSIVALLQLALGPVNGTVARFAADGHVGRVRTLVREVERRVAGYGFLALIIGLIAAVPLAAFWRYRSPAPLLIALSAAYVMVLLSVPRGALRGLQAFGSLNVSTISEAALRLACGLPLLYWWVSATAGLLPYLVAVSVAFLLSMHQLRQVWGDSPAVPLDGSAVRRFVWPMLLLMSGYAAFQNLDMLVVKRVFDPGQADVYGIAFFLTGRTMAVLAAPFSTLMLPLLANATNSSRAPRRLFFRVSGIFIALATIPLVLLAVWPQELLQVLYGERFVAAAPLLLPLATVRLMGHLTQLIALACAASGRFEFLMVFLGGLAAELVALLLWNGTATEVVTVLFIVQAITLLFMALQHLTRSDRRSS